MSTTSHRFAPWRTAACVVALLAASCQSVPDKTPTEAAAAMADMIVARDSDAADDMFGRLEASVEHREVAFSVLYAHGRDAYEDGDYPTATRFLRFLERHYPAAGAPKEALLYALFLARVASDEPQSSGSLQEMDRLATAVRTRNGSAPPWIDLVAAQMAVDRGRPADGRESLRRFHARWDGNPPALLEYVEELGRYLATHSEVEP
jgi:hypothetical protein